MAFIGLEWLLRPFKAVCFWVVTFLFLVKSTTKEQRHTLTCFMSVINLVTNTATLIVKLQFRAPNETERSFH